MKNSNNITWRLNTALKKYQKCNLTNIKKLTEEAE